MSFCPSCGVNVGESAFCPQCGYSVNGQPSAYAQPPMQYVVKPVAPDAPDKGWFIIGFLCPPVGLIMYLLCHGTRPMRATSAGKGALWCVFSLAIIAIVLALINMINFSPRFVSKSSSPPRDYSSARDSSEPTSYSEYEEWLERKEDEIQEELREERPEIDLY